MSVIKNKYYIRISENSRIIKTFSSAFEEAEENDILIGEGSEVQFRATKEVLSEELQEYAEIENGLPIFNEQGLYQLKYENNIISLVSDTELQKEMKALKKPQAKSETELLREEVESLKKEIEKLSKQLAGE